MLAFQAGSLASVCESSFVSIEMQNAALQLVIVDPKLAANFRQRAAAIQSE